MPLPRTVCSNRRCHHKGKHLSEDCFRKNDSPPNCYIFHSRCNTCRKTSPIPLPSHLPESSPINAHRKKCTKCHQSWSLSRFSSQNQSERDTLCEHCRTSKFILSRLTLGPSTPSSFPNSRPQTPPSSSLQFSSSTEPRTPPPRRSAPARTPDSAGLTPSSRRASARRRTTLPHPSPLPVLRLIRPQRLVRPRHKEVVSH